MSDVVVLYEIEYYSQVLKSGSWDDEYPDWDWKTEGRQFSNEREARKCFRQFKPTADTCMARLFKVTYERLRDSYGSWLGEVDKECLDEIS